MIDHVSVNELALGDQETVGQVILRVPVLKALALGKKILERDPYGCSRETPKDT